MFVSRSLLAFLLLSIIAGASASLHAQPYERTVRDTVSLTPGSVSVENEEGSITVSTWDRDVVAYEARIVSKQAKEFVDETVIEVEKFNQKLSLVSNFEALDPQWSMGPEIYGYGVSTPDVHYTVTIPSAADLSVEGEDSAVEVTGLDAGLQIETDDGEVRVADQRGETRIDAHEGSVSVTDIRGDLKLDTHEGSATVNGLRGRLALDTHEGQAEARIDSFAAAEVDTHEGKVTLTIPRDAGFALSTELGSDGTFQSNFVLDSLRDEDGNYHGTFQGGGPLMHLSTHEGSITLNGR